MSKTTSKYAPEVRDRAVRMVLDHEKDRASRWAAVVSIAAKIGCTTETLRRWRREAASTTRSWLTQAVRPIVSLVPSALMRCI